ncbi:sensor histidine kinase [Cohnella sp. GCM10012308]|uniref:sensor histidine kinase n=1 Tax=Cohnella sp. GCM10012308 TaxID=3317329 RepID=UPI003608F6D6
MTASRDRSKRSARSPILKMSRGPIIGWIAIAFGGTLVVQSIASLQLVHVLFYNGLILLHASLIWHADSLTNKRPWLYVIVQSLLVNGAALLVPDGSPLLLAALSPIVVGQSFVIFPDKKGYIFTFAMNLLLFIATTIGTSGAERLPFYFAWYIPMCVVILGMTNLAVKQLQSQFRTQAFLTELEVTHQRVEELTLVNERQRMARDLHDTLAQGLAGLIMQLEAADAHLSSDRAGRAQEIVRQAMGRARRTMADARGVIDDLRSLALPVVDFVQAVSEEIEYFRQHSSLRVHLELMAPIPLSKLLSEHALHIVRECLTNADKHAEASDAWIRIRKMDNMLHIDIRDDGKGFDKATIGGNLGHYGLVGIQERVRIIGGSFEIDSDAQGTRIRIQAPLPEGE